MGAIILCVSRLLSRTEWAKLGPFKNYYSYNELGRCSICQNVELFSSCKTLLNIAILKYSLHSSHNCTEPMLY